MADPNERNKLLSFSLAVLPGFAIGLVLFLLFRAENTYPSLKDVAQGCAFAQCFDAFTLSLNIEAFFFYLIFSLSAISVLMVKSRDNRRRNEGSTRKLLVTLLIVLFATVVVDVGSYQLSTRYPKIFTKMASVTKSHIPCYAMWSGGFWWETKASCFFTYGAQRGALEVCKKWNFEEYAGARILCQTEGG